MVFGTFDGLHPGHLNFFKQAKDLKPSSRESFLIVSVARDKNVKKIKGRLPLLGEKKRKKLVENSKLADKVILGSLHDYLAHIKKENPDVIALGYDQKSPYVDNLRKNLQNYGISPRILRLRPYMAHIYKNRLLKKKR